jgi:hypothetical protein
LGGWRVKRRCGDGAMIRNVTDVTDEGERFPLSVARRCTAGPAIGPRPGAEFPGDTDKK